MLLHALAPGVHALQLRAEQQQGEVVRACCFAGNAPVTGDQKTPPRIDDQHRRLIDCAVGKLLLANHDFVPATPMVVGAQRPTASTLAVTNAQIERDRRPEREPARGPPA